MKIIFVVDVKVYKNNHNTRCKLINIKHFLGKIQGEFSTESDYLTKISRSNINVLSPPPCPRSSWTWAHFTSSFGCQYLFSFFFHRKGVNKYTIYVFLFINKAYVCALSAYTISTFIRKYETQTLLSSFYRHRTWGKRH